MECVHNTALFLFVEYQRDNHTAAQQTPGIDRWRWITLLHGTGNCRDDSTACQILCCCLVLRTKPVCSNPWPRDKATSYPVPSLQLTPCGPSLQSCSQHVLVLRLCPSGAAPCISPWAETEAAREIRWTSSENTSAYLSVLFLNIIFSLKHRSLVVSGWGSCIPRAAFGGDMHLQKATAAHTSTASRGLCCCRNTS